LADQPRLGRRLKNFSRNRPDARNLNHHIVNRRVLMAISPVMQIVGAAGNADPDATM
jgi:hypothetical protein